MNRLARTLISHIVSFGVLSGILVAGLWPFHVPLNEITWLSDRPGIRFGEYAYIVSRQTFSPTKSPRTKTPAEHSVEVYMESRQLDDSNTFLTFYEASSPVRFALRQVGRSLNVDQYGGDGQSLRHASLAVPDIFTSVRPVLVTVVGGDEGTTVYLDGALARSAPDFDLDPRGFAGRLLIGNSPIRDDSWGGELLGVAVYDFPLSRVEVRQHWECWRNRECTGLSDAVALYSFRQGNGDIARSDIPGGPDLLIPRRYGILNETFLAPFWREFDFTRGFWKDVLKNIAGFIPFGLVFRAYLPMYVQTRRVGILTVASGFLLSLTIEILQGFLPTRDSDTTDVLSNTLGTALGVVLYRFRSGASEVEA